MLARNLRNLVRVRPMLRNAVRNGHDHHGPNMPPFARLAPPTGPIPEEVELVWDDTVAPEACIDFDNPSADSKEILQGWAVLGTFFATLVGYIYLTDPVGSNPVALRSTVLPFDGLKYELGLGPSQDEHHEEEEEDDE